MTAPANTVKFSLKRSANVPRSGESAPLPSTSGRQPRITQALALAISSEEMISTGTAKDYADVARLACLCRERVSQIVRLTFLAPDIQVEVLSLPYTPAGRFPISETALRKVAGLLDWAEQRNAWQELKWVSGLR
jgi:hypothetical protein